MTKKKYFNEVINQLSIDSNILRYTTPKDIAEYRSKRLSCDTIIDASCGIGGQAIYFSKHCKHVYAIDINKKKIKIAKKICKKLNINNITFFNGNSLDKKIINSIKSADILFLDPERPDTEIKRSFNSLQPNIEQIMKCYNKVVKLFVFEIPPKIETNLIKYNCEKEYISLNGSLNRLTLYFWLDNKKITTLVSLPILYKIKKYDVSENNYNIENIIQKYFTKNLREYIYEVDSTVIFTGMINELIDDILQNSVRNNDIKIYIYYYNNKKILLTSDYYFKNPFVKNEYKLLKEINRDDYHKKNKVSIYEHKLFKNIKDFLNTISINKIILKGVIDPNDYNTMYEIIDTKNNNNNIGEVIHIFFLDSNILILKLLNINHNINNNN